MFSHSISTQALIELVCFVLFRVSPQVFSVFLFLHHVVFLIHGLIDHRYHVLFNGLLRCFAVLLLVSLWFLGRTSLITACSHLREMLIKAQTVFVPLQLVYLKDLTCNYRLISKHLIVIIIVLICFNYVNALIMCSIDLSIKHRNILQPNEVAVCFCRQSLNRLIFAHSFICQKSDDSNLNSGVLIKLFHLSCVYDQMPVKWLFMFGQLNNHMIHELTQSSNKCVEI